MSPTTTEDPRQQNRKLVVEAIRLHGPISRVEVARLTGLGPPMITGLTSDLLEQEIIIETGRRKGQRGQPAIDLEINPNGRFSIGFELARDHLTGVLMNLTGDVLENVHHEWKFPAPELALPLIAKYVEDLLQQTSTPQQRLLGVGVAMPGPFVSDDRHVVNPINFPNWERFPIVDNLTELLTLPVYVENDAIAAAIGEQFHGKGQTYQDFFYLYFGASMGGAMIQQRHPYQGFSPNTGELRRIKHGSKGKRDVIGQFLGLNFLYEFLQNYGIQVSEPQGLQDLFDRQNMYFWEWLNESVERLDTILHAINALLGPEAIIFGGRLPEPILTYLIERLQLEASATKASQPDRNFIYLPTLLQAASGELSSALGAAALPLYQAFSSKTG